MNNEMLYHSMNKKNELVSVLAPSDKFIFTEQGNFKRRKNGRVILRVDDEIIRCTPTL